MKKLWICALSLIVVSASSPSFAREEITELQENTDRLYRHAAGEGDGAFTALGSSMLGWGIGLAAAIVITSIVVHSSGGQ